MYTLVVLIIVGSTHATSVTVPNFTMEEKVCDRRGLETAQQWSGVSGVRTVSWKCLKNSE